MDMLSKSAANITTSTPVLVAVAPPPNYQECLEAFPWIASQAIIFAYGDTIYNPGGIYIPPELIAHECVHLERQERDPVGWWDSYLESREFRLLEEIPSHKAEYRHYCSLVLDRNKRNRYAVACAQRLAGKLYELDITYKQALKEITHA